MQLKLTGSVCIIQYKMQMKTQQQTKKRYLPLLTHKIKRPKLKTTDLVLPRSAAGLHRAVHTER